MTISNRQPVPLIEVLANRIVHDQGIECPSQVSDVPKKRALTNRVLQNQRLNSLLLGRGQALLLLLLVTGKEPASKTF